MPCGATKAEVAINNPAKYVYICSLHPPNITLSLQSSYRLKYFVFSKNLNMHDWLMRYR